MKKQTLISISVALALSFAIAESAYARCGDGVLVIPDEQCDDGNNVGSAGLAWIVYLLDGSVVADVEYLGVA